MNIKGTRTPLGNKDINSPIDKYVASEPTRMWSNTYDYWFVRIAHEPTCCVLANAACSGSGEDYDALKERVREGWRHGVQAETTSQRQTKG